MNVDDWEETAVADRQTERLVEYLLQHVKIRQSRNNIRIFMETGNYAKPIEAFDKFVEDSSPARFYHCVSNRAEV